MIRFVSNPPAVNGLRHIIFNTMKKQLFKNYLLALVLLLNAFAVAAQDKIDTVFLINGQKKEGKVTAIHADAIQFVYKGETLEYEFKKAEINKIEFASGRTEIMTNLNSTPAPASDNKNKIAVVPFEFITNDSSLNTEAMAQQLQTDSYNSLRENTNGLQVQDPITTNSLMAKAGITQATVKTKTPKEMALLLGVEYVVYGAANVTNKGNSSYGSGVSTYNGKETEKKDGRKDNTKSSGTVYSSSNATTITNYNTKIDLSFYDDQGKVLYSEERNSFGSGFDAYHATLNYLIKRCPFGSKAK